MILRAVIIWAIVATAFAALSWWQWGLETARADKAEAQLITCNARVRNIQAARERENEIPDDLGRFDLPPGWLLAE